ncbi:transporter substrate-binding protein [Palleronia sp. LCG004]|uniref:transporter substrate-binding protein n=1 Tax=Palleronia sp. LCG004 TaxID=3079304 RepID=UPI0029428EFE|nr:transporter substrate-binding protein [Palleronia sp. LCG004]WOI57119.1 transporter substrate-binding protein [Palleronia sp. LCG004]
MALKLGLIFSTTGSYAALGRSALAGALGAIEGLAERDGIRIEPVIRDPGGDVARYEAAASELLDQGVRHIVGAITSWSRKDMIPVLERKDGLLWYPAPYEGFECSDHVVYLGAAPNHHVVPAIDWIAGQGMRRVYLVGSNYVWGWETLRLAREGLGAAGIEIAGERYVPLGSTDHSHVVDEIARTRPDCVINSLIGPSNESFLAGLAARDPARCGRAGHMASFNQTEADLDALGSAADGLLSAGGFFEEDAGPALRRAARDHAPNGRVSAFLASAHAAVEILADAVHRAGTDAPRAVFAAASDRPVPTAMGKIRIDPVMRHAALAPRLALARNGRFDIIGRATDPVSADPYLTTWTGPGKAPARPELRIVT